VCIRDGGEWRECREVLSLGGGNVPLGLQRLIEKEYKKINATNRVRGDPRGLWLMVVVLAVGESVSVLVVLLHGLDFWHGLGVRIQIWHLGGIISVVCIGVSPARGHLAWEVLAGSIV